jgi:arylsulfatase A
VHNTFKDRWAIRSGSWVLIDAQDGAHSQVPEWFAKAEGFEPNPHAGMLFDLSVDVGQRHNVFAEHPDVVGKLRALLVSERARSK